MTPDAVMGTGIERAVLIHKSTHAQGAAGQAFAVPLPTQAAVNAAHDTVIAGAGVEDGLSVLGAGEKDGQCRC